RGALRGSTRCATKSQGIEPRHLITSPHPRQDSPRGRPRGSSFDCNGTGNGGVGEILRGNYLLNLKLERARELLRNPSISLIDIALDCGFSSHSHMSRLFHKFVGVTPSAYRRSLRPSTRHWIHRMSRVKRIQ